MRRDVARSVPRGGTGPACCSRARLPSMAAHCQPSSPTQRRSTRGRRTACRRRSASCCFPIARARDSSTGAWHVLPTISVRPGRPNQAASSFASGDHPRAARTAKRRSVRCGEDLRLWLSSPRRAIESLVALHDVDGDVLGTRRIVDLPGISVSVAQMVAALRTVAGDAVADRIRCQRDEAIERIVGSWPGAWDADARACAGACRRRRASKQSCAPTSKTTCTDPWKKSPQTKRRSLIEDGDAILISGSGGGHAVPEALLAAVERRFLAEGKPRGLTSVSVVGVGDRAALGASHLAHEGLLKRAITSALVDSPGLVRLAAEDKIEAYTLPQGVLSQLMRDMAAGRPGLLTKTGLHTFVDPRQQGARQSPRTPPDFVEVVDLAGEEWLFFKPVPVNVAFLRGTTADEDGNVTMEQEAVLGEMLAMAQATRRAGGIVIVQVKRMARRGTLPAQAREDSRHPGRLRRRRSPSSGRPTRRTTTRAIPASCAFRSATSSRCRSDRARSSCAARRWSSFPAPICNLGAGVSTGLSTIAAEEGLLDAAVLTNEQGTDRRRADHRPRFGRRAEFRGDDRAAGAVRFLRRRRPRSRVPVVRRSRCARATSTSAASATRSSASAASSTSARTRDACLQRHAHRGRPRHRLGGRPDRHPQGRPASQVRAEARADLLQREHGPRSAARSRCSSPSARCSASATNGLELIEIAPGVDAERDVIAHMGFRPVVSTR